MTKKALKLLIGGTSTRKDLLRVLCKISKKMLNQDLVTSQKEMVKKKPQISTSDGVPITTEKPSERKAFNQTL